MNDNDLVRKLSSVGKRAFAEYYDLFESFALEKVKREEAIEVLINEGISNIAGAAIRVSNAKLIFESGREADALRLILQSKRLPLSVLKKAQILLDKTIR